MVSDLPCNRAYAARAATPADMEGILRLANQAWRVYLTVRSDLLEEQLRSALSWVVGQGDRLDGFISAELRADSIAVITAAALHDDRPVSEYADAALPVVESHVHHRGANSLVQVGYAPWLTESLGQRGFLKRGWVVSYGWDFQPVAPGGNMAVTISSATEDDLPALLNLDQQVFGPIWHKQIADFRAALRRAFLFTVAKRGDQLTGYQWCEKVEEHGHLTRLAVRPDWEGKGVGTRLLTEAMTAMVRAGATWITLNTQEENDRSRRLYERHGFRLINHKVAVLWKDL